MNRISQSSFVAQASIMRFSLRSLMAAFAVLAVVLTVILFVTKDYRERMALRQNYFPLALATHESTRIARSTLS